MKKSVILLLIFASLPVYSATNDEIADLFGRIKWYGGDTLMIESRSGIVIHVDLSDNTPPKKGDILLYTHPHMDHYGMGVKPEAMTTDALVVAPFEIPSVGKKIKPGDTIEWKGITITAIPAYNFQRPAGHPKENGWVGYVITVDGVRIYMAGDTERVPEMKTVRADISFIPLGQSFTMTSVEEAAQAAIDTGASIAVPVHWGTSEGSPEDTVKFAKLLKGKIRVIRMKLE